MRSLCRKLSQVLYTQIAKPVMFQFSPDGVHESVVKLGRQVQRISFVRWMLRSLWQHQSPLLTQQLHGIEFANPVGVAAGFDKNAQLVPLLESIGLGFATCGSITGYTCAGNDKPWFHRLPAEKSIVVNAGLPNVGSQAVADALARDALTAKRHLPLILSVARTNSRASSTDREAIADYVTAIQNLRPYANMFELNISCPNTYGGEPFTTPERLEQLLAAVDACDLAQPLTIKMPSNLLWPEFDALLTVIVRHNIQFVTISNLRKDRKGVAVDNSVKGNLSGKPTCELSNTLIRETYSKYGGQLAIIGVGGIFSAEDAYAKIKNGASLVGLVTGLIYEGPSLIGDINHGLEAHLKADGFTHISQAIGADVTLS